jgi:hypothetical protein
LVLGWCPHLLAGLKCHTGGCTLEDAVGAHTCLLEANVRGIQPHASHGVYFSYRVFKSHNDVNTEGICNVDGTCPGVGPTTTLAHVACDMVFTKLLFNSTLMTDGATGTINASATNPWALRTVLFLLYQPTAPPLPTTFLQQDIYSGIVSGKANHGCRVGCTRFPTHSDVVECYRIPASAGATGAVGRYRTLHLLVLVTSMHLLVLVTSMHLLVLVTSMRVTQQYSMRVIQQYSMRVIQQYSMRFRVVSTFLPVLHVPCITSWCNTVGAPPGVVSQMQRIATACVEQRWPLRFVGCSALPSRCFPSPIPERQSDGIVLRMNSVAKRRHRSTHELYC